MLSDAGLGHWPAAAAEREEHPIVGTSQGCDYVSAGHVISQVCDYVTAGYVISQVCDYVSAGHVIS